MADQPPDQPGEKKDPGEALLTWVLVVSALILIASAGFYMGMQK